MGAYDYNIERFFDGLNDPDIMAAFAAFAVVFGIILIIALIIGLVLYILRSVALATLSKNRGMSLGGLAWIPIVGVYRVGSVADDVSAKEGSKTIFRILMLIFIFAPWIMSVFTTIPALNSLMHGYDYYNDYYGFGASAGLSSLTWLISVAMVVVRLLSLNKVFKCYKPGSATAWTVLSFFFPFLYPIFLFSIRNQVPAEQWPSPQQGYYTAGQPYYPPQQPPQQYQQPGQPYYPPQPGQPYYPQQQPPQQYQQPGQPYYPPQPPQQYQQPPQDYPPPEQPPVQPPQAPNSPYSQEFDSSSDSE